MTTRFDILEGVHIAGRGSELFDITVEDGKFSRITENGKNDASAVWIAPGMMDLHLHLGWTDFDREEQNKRDKSEVESRIADSLSRLLHLGITTVRDACGISASELLSIAERARTPNIFPCAGVYGEDASLSDKNAGWVKIFATGGVGCDSDLVTVSAMSKEHFLAAVQNIHSAGKKVAVHTWGGDSLDWAIEAGVDSVEHCIYMTREQAEKAAQAGIPYVPTVAVYRMMAEGAECLALPDIFVERAKRACEHHGKALEYAKASGVKISFGTDFYSDPALLEYEAREIFVMRDYGMTMAEIWCAATENAADILGIGDTFGRIETGYTADAVLYSSDPYLAENDIQLKSSIVQVIKNGSIVV